MELHANFTGIYTALTICNEQIELQIKIERAILSINLLLIIL